VPLTNLHDLVQTLRRTGGDSTTVEVKTAAGGLPESLTSSLSALANLPGGGWLLLGLDERLGFASVQLPNPQTLRQGLANKARAYEPPVVLEFVDDAKVDGVPIIAARVRECDPSAKPCRLVSSRQAWLRGWDGDYLMSALEEQAFLAQRTQPRFDRAAVPGATRQDLDEDLLAAWTDTATTQDPSGLGRFTGGELLRRAGILTADGAPTVAGLLTLGVHPQQFFPRHVINLAATGAGSVRAGQVTTLTGPIPSLLAASLDWARQTMPRAVIADADGGVRDEWLFPLEAFRELISNALVHRDLDSWSESLAIEVRLQPDRLIVTNPGGLYGISVDRLGREAVTSARNARLIEICRYARTSDYPGYTDGYGGRRVVETLATGIPRILATVAERGQPAPHFQDTGIRFTAILRTSGTMPTTPPLTSTERRVLAALAAGPKAVTELEIELTLQGPNIRKALRALTAKGFVQQHGGRGRPTTYQVSPR
jgi:ATP-dependent DNA helicase RecG